MFERITEICIPPPLQHNSFNLWYDINNLCISSNKDIMKGCVVMKKYLLALLFMLCTVSQAFASDWYFAGSSYRVQAYIDNASVRKNESEAIVWVKYIKLNGDYDLYETRFTRTPPTTSILYAVSYTANGELISSFSTSPDDRTPDPIAPDSLDDSMWQLIWPY